MKQIEKRKLFVQTIWKKTNRKTLQRKQRRKNSESKIQSSNTFEMISTFTSFGNLVRGTKQNTVNTAITFDFNSALKTANVLGRTRTNLSNSSFFGLNLFGIRLIRPKLSRAAITSICLVVFSRFRGNNSYSTTNLQRLFFETVGSLRAASQTKTTAEEGHKEDTLDLLPNESFP